MSHRFARLLVLAATLAAASAATAVTAATAEPLHVIATIIAKSSRANALRTDLIKLAAAARAEDGNLGYVLYEDRAKAGRFYTDELWRDDAALDAHLGSPAMKAATPALSKLLAKAPVISRLRGL